MSHSNPTSPDSHSASSQELHIPGLNHNDQPSPDVSMGLPGTLTPTSTLERPSSSRLGDTLRRVRVASIIPSPIPSLNDESTLHYEDQENSDTASHFSSSESEDDGGVPKKRDDRHKSFKLAKKEQRRKVLIRSKTHDSFRLTTSKFMTMTITMCMNTSNTYSNC